MQNCSQSKAESVYQHGISVRDHLFQLIHSLRNNSPLSDWKLPNWLWKYRLQIINNLMPDDILEEYTIYHDCGKVYCKTIDKSGKQHFPNHAEISYQKWLEIGGNPQAALLMKMDMDIHLLKAGGAEEFCKRNEAISLLLTGLSEIHANCKMFGGVESTSFKIKYKQIDKRGKAICEKLFGDKNVIE